MSEHRVKVENGKYEFIQRGGWKLDILRHGKPWAENVDCSKAIGTMMAELDAARVVLEAARRVVVVANEGIAPVGGLVSAFEKYDRLVDAMKLLRLHSDDVTGPPSKSKSDYAIVFFERERFRKAIWKVMREFTHVAFTDLLRDAVYEMACGYHYYRQEERDIEAASKRLEKLRSQYR